MKKYRLALIGVVALAFVAASVLAQEGATEKPPAERTATLNVQSVPAGVHMLAQTCFTVSTGACGTTNWTSTNAGSIPHTSYQYPVTETIGGTSYTLDSASLSGCNQGTSGSPVSVCEVSVATGATATISATYKPTPVSTRLATLNVESTPAGVVLTGPTCFTVSAGTCGTTNWTSTSTTAISATSYTFPATATIAGTNYALSGNSLTGCNVSTSGSTPDVCTVSVAANATGTISATYHVVTPPPPNALCTTGGTNLVQNPSFEMVTLSRGSSTSYGPIYNIDQFYPQGVLNWMPITLSGLYSAAVSGYQGINLSAFNGTKYVVIPKIQGEPDGSIVGNLSSPVVPGATYVISARVATTSTQGGTFNVWLRDSVSGAGNPLNLQTTITQSSPQWQYITATVTPSTSFNQVVVRYSSVGNSIGLLDSVYVGCKGTPWWNRPLELAGVVLMFASLVGAFTTWLLRKKGHNYIGTVTLVK